MTIIVVKNLLIQFCHAMSKFPDMEEKQVERWFECENYFRSISIEKFFEISKQIGESRGASLQDIGERFAPCDVKDGFFQSGFPKLESCCSDNDNG